MINELNETSWQPLVYLIFSGMKHASAKTKLYITTYAKFISFMEFMTEKCAEQNKGDDDFELKISRKVS